MFDRSDLDALEDASLRDWRYMRCYPGLHYVVYPQFAFRVPDSEQTIRITRAPKHSGDNGLRFWISAELAESTLTTTGFNAPYFRSASFKRIGETEFNRIVQGQCAELSISVSLPLHEPSGFIGALSMHNMESDLLVSIVAEYEDEFIHLYWESTA